MSNVAGDSTVMVIATVVMVTMTVSISVSDGGLNQSKLQCVGSALRAHNYKTFGLSKMVEKLYIH